MPRYLRFRKKKTNKKIDWASAPDIAARIAHLVQKASIDWVDVDSLTCFRSENANTRAYARIWGLSRVWQLALKIGPSYVVEVISEKFDRLPQKEQDKILLHELAHIPRNFSGALTPHTHKGKGNFHDKLKLMIAAYESSSDTRH